MKNVILVKPGELWLKGKNRKMFMDRLIKNIRYSTGIGMDAISAKQGRVYIEVDDDRKDSVLASLSRTFGHTGAVRAIKTENDIESIKTATLDLMNSNTVNTFKIQTVRQLKSFELNSNEVNVILGQHVLEMVDNVSVDVHDPDLEIKVEIRPEGSFIYALSKHETVPGGLPVGTSGKGLALMSGGIDSPVALWLTTKRGMSTDAIYFHSPPFTSERAKEKIIDICRELSEWRSEPIDLYVIHFTDIQTETSKVIDSSLLTLVHRRFMTLIAESIAAENGYSTMITGDSLGQVASQTIENMRSVEHGTTLPILRPLIGYDKEETILLSKRIGTFKISIRPHEDCCTVFSSKNPRTKATWHEIDKSMGLVDSESLIKEALLRTEKIRIEKKS